MGLGAQDLRTSAQLLQTPKTTFHPLFVTVAPLLILHWVCWPQQNMTDHLLPKWQAVQPVVTTADQYGSMEKVRGLFPPCCLVFSRHPPLPTHLPDLIAYTWSTSLCVCVCVLKRGHHKVVTTPHQEASIFLQSWPASQLISNILTHTHTHNRFLLHISQLYPRYWSLKMKLCNFSSRYLSEVWSYCGQSAVFVGCLGPEFSLACAG